MASSDADLLLAAGGGGGASYTGGQTDKNYWGQDGQAGINGGKGCPGGWAGGVDGKGGRSETNDHGGGAGAGWKTNGDCQSYNHVCGVTRSSDSNSFKGGDAMYTGYMEGGFGGGAGVRNEGGGGGGYSGGGGTQHGHGGGGGGGSYISEDGKQSDAITGGNGMPDGFASFEWSTVDEVVDQVDPTKLTLTACEVIGRQPATADDCAAEIATKASTLYKVAFGQRGVRTFTIPATGYE